MEAADPEAILAKLSRMALFCANHPMLVLGSDYVESCGPAPASRKMFDGAVPVLLRANAKKDEDVEICLGFDFSRSSWKWLFIAAIRLVQKQRWRRAENARLPAELFGGSLAKAKSYSGFKPILAEEFSHRSLPRCSCIHYAWLADAWRDVSLDLAKLMDHFKRATCSYLNLSTSQLLSHVRAKVEINARSERSSPEELELVMAIAGEG